jgi:hypothetical protein
MGLFSKKGKLVEIEVPLEEGFTILPDHDPARLTESNSSRAARLAEESAKVNGEKLLKAVFGPDYQEEDFAKVNSKQEVKAEEKELEKEPEKEEEPILSNSSFIKYPFKEESVVESKIESELESEKAEDIKYEPVSVTLINATNDDVYVLADGKMKKLDRVLSPWILNGVGKQERNALQLTFEGKNKVRHANIGWAERGAESISSGATVNLPPIIDGVLYLVEPEILIQFMEREDFVTVALYGSQFNKKNKKLNRLFYISAVTRTPYDYWHPAMPDVTRELWEDAKDEEAEASLENNSDLESLSQVSESVLDTIPDVMP